jgi:FtsZ-binding cell division protein ZapB
MDLFEALEKRVGKLIEAYEGLQARVAELEEENVRLRQGGTGAEELRERIAILESERADARERLEKVLKKLSSLGM